MTPNETLAERTERCQSKLWNPTIITTTHLVKLGGSHAIKTNGIYYLPFYFISNYNLMKFEI